MGTGGGGAASPNFQHLCETLQILHYNCIKQHKNIEKLLFVEQNIVISFCPSLCLLWLVVSLPFSTAHVFQFFDTVPCKILNVTSDQCSIPSSFIKKRLQHRCFCEICKIFKNTVFTEHLWWLLLWPKQIKRNKNMILYKYFC